MLLEFLVTEINMLFFNRISSQSLMHCLKVSSMSQACPCHQRKIATSFANSNHIGSLVLAKIAIDPRILVLFFLVCLNIRHIPRFSRSLLITGLFQTWPCLLCSSMRLLVFLFFFLSDSIPILD